MLTRHFRKKKKKRKMTNNEQQHATAQHNALSLSQRRVLRRNVSLPSACSSKARGRDTVGGRHCVVAALPTKGRERGKKRERSTRNRRQSRGRFLFLSFTLGLSLCFFPFFASSLPLAHRCFVKKSARGPRTLGGYEKGVAVVVLACVRMCRLKPRTAHVTQDRRQ